MFSYLDNLKFEFALGRYSYRAGHALQYEVDVHVSFSPDVFN